MSWRAARIVPNAIALAAVVVGVWLVRPSVTKLRARASYADLVGLAGPFRGVPLPFLWTAWGEAQRRNDSTDAARFATWLTWLLPEREDLFLGFAYDLAYNAAARESNTARRARLLLDALHMLDEGQRAHPDEPMFAVNANFILLDRCVRDDALRAAFETVSGRDVLEIAGAYAAIALELGPGIRLPLLRRAMTSEWQGIAALESGDAAGALRHFSDAAAAWETTEPVRARLLQQLVAELPAGIPNLSKKLRNWLTNDHRLGRTNLWRRG